MTWWAASSSVYKSNPELARLEKELNAEVMDRDSYRVELTDAAQTLS